MSWFARLLGGGSPAQKRAPGGASPIVVAMRGAAVPCVRLVPSAVASTTKLGGAPSVDLGQPWPQVRGVHLDFVAEVDLATLRAVGSLDWLPDDGVLLFFCRLDQGAWKVLHILRNSAATEPAQPRFLERFLFLKAALSYPDPDRLGGALDGCSDSEMDEACDMATSPSPSHQIGGFPEPVQGDEMELECQLDSTGVDTRMLRSYAIAKGDLADWRLLLQVDSDDFAGMMWGDLGKLYFWIRESDARRCDFSRVWMIMQCH